MKSHENFLIYLSYPSVNIPNHFAYLKKKIMKDTTKFNRNMLTIFFTSIYILSITGCTKETETMIANQKQVSSQEQSNAANSFTSSAKFNVSIEVFVPCANNGKGEDVILTGTVHETYHTTVNKNKFHMKIIDNPQGVSGIGAVTGIKYHGTGATQEEVDQTLINGQYEGTFVNNFRIIGKGAGNNYLVHETFHYTVNANGVMTSFLDNVSIVCK